MGPQSYGESATIKSLISFYMFWSQGDNGLNPSLLARQLAWPPIIPKVIGNMKDHMHNWQSIHMSYREFNTFFPLKNVVSIPIKSVLYSNKKGTTKFKKK